MTTGRINQVTVCMPNTFEKRRVMLRTLACSTQKKQTSLQAYDKARDEHSARTVKHAGTPDMLGVYEIRREVQIVLAIQRIE